MELATVLIDDDDDNLGQGLRLALRRHHRVLYAEGAPEALAVLEREAVDLVRTSPELAATLEDRLQRAALRRSTGGEDEG